MPWVTKMDIPNFKTARQQGEVINKDGYHQPDKWSYRRQHCGCENTTKKGSYRDVSVEINGMVVHYYHQTPVVAEKDGKYWLNSGGYRTSTTKERINRYCPFRVFQDFEWYVKYNNETLEFKDGMVLEG